VELCLGDECVEVSLLVLDGFDMGAKGFVELTH
jgi:hypothetical protein